MNVYETQNAREYIILTTLQYLDMFKNKWFSKIKYM
jgi:hypothetical protein